MSLDWLLTLASAAVDRTAESEHFRAMIAPGEPERAPELEKLSTCALFLRGCLAYAIMSPLATTLSPGEIQGPPPPNLVRAVPPRLWAPYRIGMAMADLVEVHRQAGGCRYVGPEPAAYHPELLAGLRPGSIVVVGRGGAEHVYLVERMHRDRWPDEGYELDAIEAGQVDAKGRQCVRRKRHEITPAGVDMCPSSRTGGVVAKPVSYVLDPAVLFGRAG